MPLGIFDLQNDRKTLLIDQYDLTITYRPNQMTPARELAILRSSALPAGEGDDDDIDELLANGERNIVRQITSMIELIESWDFMGPLVADDEGQLMAGVSPNWDNDHLEKWAAERGATVMVPAGEVIPLTMECLRVLPSYFLTEVVTAINKDMRPDPKKRRR